jgi:hypothetical protein
LFNVTSESVGEVRDRHVVLKLFPTVDLGAWRCTPTGRSLGALPLGGQSCGHGQTLVAVHQLGRTFGVR